MQIASFKARVSNGSFSEPRKIIAELGLAEGHTLADFGAGSGHYAIEAGRRVGHTGKVYAIDVQQDLLARVKNLANAERVRSVEIIWGDIEKVGGTKLKDGAVDVVLLCNILFQLAKRGNVLTEAKRVLKDKGRVVAIDWTDSFGGLGPAASDIVTEKEARELFEQSGFTVEKAISAGAHHWGLILRK